MYAVKVDIYTDGDFGFEDSEFNLKAENEVERMIVFSKQKWCCWGELNLWNITPDLRSDISKEDLNELIYWFRRKHCVNHM